MDLEVFLDLCQKNGDDQALDYREMVQKLVSLLQEANRRRKTSKKVEEEMEAGSEPRQPDSSQGPVDLLMDEKRVSKCVGILLDLIQTHFNPETQVLSASSIAFLLLLLIRNEEDALRVYLNILLQTFNSNRADDPSNWRQLAVNEVSFDEIKAKPSYGCCILFSGLLNCRELTDVLVRTRFDLFLDMHTVVVEVCSQKVLHEFHAFRLLERWFKSYQKIKLSQDQKEIPVEDIFNATLSVVDINWENPVNRVNDSVKAIYKLLIEIHVDYGSKETRSQLIFNQLNASLGLSWTSKAKYRKLSILLPIIGWRDMIEREPSLPNQLFKHLPINNLASSISETYKAVIRSMSCLKTDERLTLWKEHFLTPVADALTSSNLVVHNNVVAHILPFTLKNIDGSFYSLMSHLKESHFAQVSLVRLAATSGVRPIQWPDEEWLNCVLFHEKDSVRLEALSLLFEGNIIKNKQRIMSTFKLFLFSNLNIDSPLFRQKIVGQMEHFLNFMAKLSSEENKSFVASLVDDLTINLLPGASFQRKTTTLSLLESILKRDSYLLLSSKTRRELLSRRLLLSIMDREDNIRKLSASLLTQCLQSVNGKEEEGYLTVERLMSIASNLLNFPRHQEAHSGGLLMAVVNNGYRELEFNYKGKTIRGSLDLLNYILSEARAQHMFATKGNVLKSSKESPIHGYLLALSCILSSNNKVFQSLYSSDKASLSNLFVDMIVFGEDLVGFLLNCLSVNSSKASPSFLEMSEALHELVLKEEKEEVNRETELIEIEFVVSYEYQLLLSFCWLNIKEVCSLYSKLTELNSSRNNRGNLLDYDMVLRMGHLMLTVLLRFRHKGAIESCCLSLTQFTKFALTAEAGNNKLPKQLLTEAMEEIMDSVKSSSVTRRAAGLGMIIQAILTGEVMYFKVNAGRIKHSSTTCFNFAINRLIQMVNSSGDGTVTDSMTDDLQSICLHILRSVMNTALLSSFTMSVVETLIPISIRGLSSKQWSVRNASLQLFGSCCVKILGQKKALEDSEDCDLISSTLTSFELFSRFTTLKTVIEKCLIEGVNEGHYCDHLVPVLSLLSSLSPCTFSLSAPHIEDCSTLIERLLSLLGNSIWKVRSLAARSLLSFLTTNQLIDRLVPLITADELTNNLCHGLLLVFKLILSLKKQQNIEVGEKEVDDLMACFPIQLINKVFNNNIINSEYSNLLESNAVQETVFISPDFSQFLPNESDSQWLSRMLTMSDPRQSDHLRSAVVPALDSNWLRLSTKFRSNPDIAVNFFELLLKLLEDEEAFIRQETSIFVKSFLSLKFLPSFNVAIDLTLNWALDSIDSQTLAPYLWNRLESDKYLILKLSENSDEKLILFEEEERNIFAEALFINVKLFLLLDILLECKKVKLDISDKSIERLETETEFMLNYGDFNLDNFLTFATSKLWKTYTSLFSFQARAHLVSKYLSQRDIIKGKDKEDIMDKMVSVDMSELEDLKLFSPLKVAQHLSLC